MVGTKIAFEVLHKTCKSHSKSDPMKNSAFKGMKIMMHALPAICNDESIKAQVYGYDSKGFNTVNGLPPMDTLLLHPVKRGYSKHFKRISQSNTKGFNEAEASHPHLIIVFP